MRNFPTPLCPFKKNPPLGHLCSLRHTPTRKYCQRSFWETGLSLFSKGQQTSLLGMPFVGSGLPSFSPFWGPSPSRSNATQIQVGRALRHGLAFRHGEEKDSELWFSKVTCLMSLQSLQAVAGATLPGSRQPLQDHPKAHSLHNPLSGLP